MSKLESFLVHASLVVLLVCGGCGGDESTPGTKKPATAHNSSASKSASSGEEQADALPPTAERGTLLQRLPKSTLYALRLPHVEKLSTALERSALSQLLDAPALASQRAQMDAGLEMALAELSKTVPDLDELKSRALALDGELVVAVLGIDWTTIARRSDDLEGFPITCAVMFDAGDQADSFDELFLRSLDLIEKEATKAGARDAHAEVLVNEENSWHRRILRGNVVIDMVRDGAHFMLQAAPAPDAGQDAPLALRELDDSFLASDVVRGTPDLARTGSVPVMEAFVNLEPVWSLVDVAGPAEAKRILASCGLNSIRGLSAVAALGKTGIDETFVLHSPGQKDLLSKALTNRPLDPKLARFAPPDASSAALASFDVELVFEAVTKMLPPSEKRELEAGLAAQKKEGLDWHRDVIANIGPTFGCVGELDWLALYGDPDSGGEDIDLTILVELQDAGRFRTLLAQLQKLAGPNLQTTEIQGSPVTLLDPLPVPGPNGQTRFSVQPCWHVADDVFVLSFSRSALARALSAASNSKNRGPAALKTALAEHGDDAYSVATFEQHGGATSTTIARRTAVGLESTTREGTGSAGAFVFGGGLAITASIAIPKLMAARNAANERAAIATLRNIASAQAQFQAAGVVDLDNDGNGEYGTLAEMSGSVPLRGSKTRLNPPVLSNKMAPDPSGVVQRSGYAFRVHLFESAMRNGDAGERGFTVYAWPLERGTTGTRVFALDEEGDVRASDNLGHDQGYEGLTRVPKPGAHYPAPANAGVESTNRGRDGGTWLVVE